MRALRRPAARGNLKIGAEPSSRGLEPRISSCTPVNSKAQENQPSSGRSGGYVRSGNRVVTPCHEGRPVPRWQGRGQGKFWSSRRKAASSRERRKNIRCRVTSNTRRGRHSWTTLETWVLRSGSRRILLRCGHRSRSPGEGLATGWRSSPWRDATPTPMAPRASSRSGAIVGSAAGCQADLGRGLRRGSRRPGQPPPARDR